MPKRVDANQTVVVAALRAVGAEVCHLHAVGRGVPDLLIGFRGQNFLLEVKDAAQPPSKRKLTPDERVWHDRWRGQVWIVCSADDALRAIGAIE
jgi:hypothetical protein